MHAIETKRLILTRAAPADAAALARFSTRNADHLSRWEPTRPDGYYSETAWHNRLTAYAPDIRAGRYLPLVLRFHDQPDVVGTANLSNIVRGEFQACHLGYAVDAEQEGQGVMSEALRAVLDHAFGAMSLNRVMANYLPENMRSAALLARLEFEREGYAKRYLKIAGEWRDHVLTAKLAPQPEELAEGASTPGAVGA
ncbi:MAG: 30S ribosomal protein S5 alanine N-acetyltransferase [Maritimibacter sp.]|nr:30S ribosomal protein S5 alanine N-acetyltransferase [Maritimibacter sp.]